MQSTLSIGGIHKKKEVNLVLSYEITVQEFLFPHSCVINRGVYPVRDGQSLSTT